MTMGIFKKKAKSTEIIAWYKKGKHIKWIAGAYYTTQDRVMTILKENGVWKGPDPLSPEANGR